MFFCQFLFQQSHGTLSCGSHVLVNLQQKTNVNSKYFNGALILKCYGLEILYKR